MTDKIPDINRQLNQTATDVTHYINEINSQPDDFARRHLDELTKSINNSQKAILNYAFKKETIDVKFDDTIKVLGDAVTFLVKKRQEEVKKTAKNQSDEEISNEMVVAINSIKYLVSLLENLRTNTPIRGVDLSDESYDTTKKVEKAGGKKFDKHKKRE